MSGIPKPIVWRDMVLTALAFVTAVGLALLGAEMRWIIVVVLAWAVLSTVLLVAGIRRGR